MTSTFLQSGNRMTGTAGATLTTGQPLLVQKTFGVVVNGVASGELYELQLNGVHSLPKATGQTWTQGELLYWDDAAKKVTTTSTSNTLIGKAHASQASGDTAGAVRLTDNG